MDIYYINEHLIGGGGSPTILLYILQLFTYKSFTLSYKNHMLTIVDMGAMIIPIFVMEVCMINSLVQFRVDEKLKNEASEIYEDLGLDLSSAVKLFFKKTIKMKKMPFSINDDDISEDEIRKKKALAIEELDSMDLNISNNLDEKDEIYNAIMEKYESIN